VLERRVMGLVCKPYKGNSDTISSERRVDFVSQESGRKIGGGKRDKRSESEKRKGEKDSMTATDFQVSIYAKSGLKGSDKMVNGARGLVVKLYNQDSGETMVLHIAASELQRVCGNRELLGEMNRVKSESDSRPSLDPLSKGLQTLLEVDELQAQMIHLTTELLDLVFQELAVMIDPLDKPTPYLTGTPRGVPPT
jgi:hypothetical protein